MTNGVLIVDEVEATVISDSGKVSRQVLLRGKHFGPIQDYLVTNGIAVFRFAHAIYRVAEDSVYLWINRNSYIGRGDRRLTCPWPDATGAV